MSECYVNKVYVSGENLKDFEDFVLAYTGGIPFDEVEANYDGLVSDEKRKQI